MFARIAGGFERRKHIGRFDRDLVTDELEDSVAGRLISLVALVIGERTKLVDRGVIFREAEPSGDCFCQPVVSVGYVLLIRLFTTSVNYYRERQASRDNRGARPQALRAREDRVLIHARIVSRGQQAVQDAP